MRYEAGRRLALHIEGKAAHRLRQLAAAGVAIALSGGLQACSSDAGWPSLNKVSDLRNILSPEERQKAVQELQKEDQSHSSGTAKAPAKSSQ